MPDKEISREELKALKRQANIRAKEDEYEKKRKEDEEKKREILEKLKRDHENQERERVERQIQQRRAEAASRAAKRAKNEKLQAKREDKIEKKMARWLAKSNGEIADIQAEQEAEEERVQQALEQARAEKRQKEQDARDAAATVKANREEIEQLRKENVANRAMQRDLRAIYKVDTLKTEATEELETFILNPSEVPLRQVLAGRLKHIDRVTDLLSNLKDMKEELKDLEEQDISTRALVRAASMQGANAGNKTVFGYVKELEQKYRANKIQPPQPDAADLGRFRNRASSPRKGSPGKMRGSPGGTMRSTR